MVRGYGGDPKVKELDFRRTHWLGYVVGIQLVFDGWY